MGITSLQAGVGRCDITPAPGTPQGGWGAQTHQRGIAADLPFYATALALSNGTETAVILDVDSIGFDLDWTTRIIDAIADLTSLPGERIRFSCTHTHSGPNTFRLATISEGLDMAVSYLESLPRRIASAAWQALQNMQPVRTAAASGSCGINVNRRLKMPGGSVVVGRNWQGITDPTVRVVRIDTLGESPLATIVHYACHPTTMAWQTRHFTPDFPGVVKQIVERNLGGTCLFLQGATGDLTPRRGFTGDLQVYRRLGAILGLEASRIAFSIETLPKRERLTGVMPSGAPIALYEDEPCEPADQTFRFLSRTVQLPARQFRPPDELESEAAQLRAEMNRLRNEGSEHEIRLATAKATQAGWRAENARLYHGMTSIARQMQAIRLGSAALVSIQGEPFIETSQAIAAASPFEHTLFSGYSNGGFGYIPTRQAHLEGGYEIEATPFSPDAADAVVREAAALLNELR